ncbi:protein kinase domain protein, partial [Ichthyophthirius multifiliis]
KSSNNKILLVQDRLDSQKKIVIKQFNNNYQFSQEKQNEIKALQDLQHPNIVKILDFDQQNILLEYMENGELFSFVEKKALPENIARFYFKQLIIAVQYIHEQSYVHRDIKLENILIDQKYNLKLADFGFSVKLKKQEIKLRKFLGTKGYMAPELEEQLPYDGKKVDIFACGVVLFCMVSQIPPFFKASQCDKYYDFFYQNNQEGYWNYISLKYKKVFSNEFKDLINAMFNIDPELRFSYEEILQHPWMDENLICTQEEAQEFLKQIV